MTNKRVDVMADINDTSCKVRQGRNWLVHILRRERVNNNCFSALGWTPEGQRVRQSSKTTWRRTVERKRNKAGESWEVAKVVEWDKKCWSESVMTLYTYWYDKK